MLIQGVFMAFENPYSLSMRMMTDTIRSMNQMYGGREDSDSVPFEEDSVSSVEKSFSSTDVRKFAELTGDENKLHTDRRYAETEGPFNEPIVHGVLVMGSVSSALAKFEGDIIIESMNELNFLKPVYVDDEVDISCRVTSMDGRRAEVEVEVVNIEQDDTVLEGETTLFDAEGMDLS